MAAVSYTFRTAFLCGNFHVSPIYVDKTHNGFMAFGRRLENVHNTIPKALDYRFKDCICIFVNNPMWKCPMIIMFPQSILFIVITFNQIKPFPSFIMQSNICVFIVEKLICIFIYKNGSSIEVFFFVLIIVDYT